MMIKTQDGERNVASKGLGGAALDTKTQWLLKFLNVDINGLIQNFENIMKPIMDDNGLVDSNLARSLVSSKFPLLSNMLPDYNFRLVDVVDGVTNTVKSLIKGVR